MRLCGTLLLPIFLAAWAQPVALAGELAFRRADGRRAELATVERPDGLWIATPAGGRRIQLSERLIAVPRDPRRLSPAALAGLGLRRLGTLPGRASTWLLQAADPRAAVRACATLAEAGLVRWAVPDFRVELALYHVPNDPLYPRQWHLGDPAGGGIALEGAWDMSRGDPQVVVAVIDTGVDPDHPDLDPARMVTGYNALDGSADAAPSELAIDHHGTACMGLAAADMDNGLGVVGVCPACSWMPIRVFERGAMMNLSALSAGIGWAVDHGAWVLSNSWGIGQELIDQGVDVEPIREAVRYAVDVGRGGLGCVVLFAAGNGDAELNAQPIGPDELPAMDETLAIGGCDQLGAVARYSDFGPMVTLLAPTWSGLAGEPRITTLDTAGPAGANKDGQNYRTDPAEGDQPTGGQEPDAAGDYTSHFSGTSAATPIVAGVAGLVLAVDPGLGWQEVRRILVSTAEKVGQQATDPRLPAAYDATGHDDHYGFGRVQAERAVALARFGSEQPDGQPCRLDLNCLHACTDSGDPALGRLCATPCLASADCGPQQDCRQGVCRAVNDRRIVGGCGCAPAGAGTGGGLPWLPGVWLLGVWLLGRGVRKLTASAGPAALSTGPGSGPGRATTKERA